MGSFTKTTRAIIGLFTGNSSSSGSGSGTPPIPPMGPVIPLQKYLDQSYQKAKTAGKLGPDLGLKTCVPISIYLRSKSTQHIYAGNSDTIDGVVHHLDDEECYSASLIKVAAMFAAFKLRAEARALIADMQAGTVPTKTVPKDFLNALKARFHLADAVDKISKATGIQLAPTYENILAVTGSTAASLAANFTSDFRSHMRRMIIPSDNCSAGECIWRLSYPYIHVKLVEDGYFDKTTMKGIWLCGDYIIDACPPAIKAHKQKYLTIDTINDCNQATPPFCGSAQDTTSKQMARLFLNILLEECVDPDSSKEMRTLLQETQQGSNKVVPPVTTPPIWNAPPPDTSFLTRTDEVTIPLLFTVDAVKIGQGPIKADPSRGSGLEVRSEGIIIKWKNITSGDPDFDSALRKKFDDMNLTGEAAICWQNLPNGLPDGSGLSPDGIVEILNTSISNFINQAAI